MVATLRDALGPGPRLRIDANSSWSLPQAHAHAGATRASTTSTSSSSPCARRRSASSASCAARSPIAVCANEGLWSEDDAYARIRAREADVYCFSPSWVGSLAAFSRLAHVAELEGLQVCKHTHGELGIAAAACQHVLLTLPNSSTGTSRRRR